MGEQRREGMRKQGVLILVLALSMIAIGLLQWNNHAFAADSSTLTVPQVIEKATPFVVAIIGKPTDTGSSYDSSSGGGSNRFDLAHGTGVIVESDGVILTNAHVVKNMKNIVVVTSNGNTYPGKTTHFDEDSDLALVKIDAKGLQAAQFGVQSEIHVGDPVLAVGTPISFALRNSVTQGIVSGMERTVNSQYLLLQTDAAINAGNSGGALLNMKGEVIGINALKYSSVGVDSLGFAIPVDTVQYVLKQFLAYGKVKRPYLGMELEEGWEAVVGLPTVAALKVSYVEPDSPVAKAGVMMGDTLTSLNGDPIKSLIQLNETLKKYLPGDTVKLYMKSGNGDVVRDVVLGEDTTGTNWKQDEDGSYIDADQGKTAIGDSHFGWSMNYPAGLVKQDAYGDGRVVFGDAKGEYAIVVQTEDKISKDLSVNSLLRKATSQSGGKVLEKKYVDTAAVPYALVSGKVPGEGYYVTRAFHHNDRLYLITLYVVKDENYKNPIKLNSYLQLMNSFALSFDKSNKSLKDISDFKDTKTITSDYGVSFELPSTWSPTGYEPALSFTDKEEAQGLKIEVTSASSGDTLQRWATRQQNQFENSFVANYRKISGLKDITIAGVPGLVNQLSYTMNKKWKLTQTYYLIKDKYKYKFEFSFEQDAKPADVNKLVDSVIASVKIQKDAMDSALGFIQDEQDLAVANATQTYTNEKYKYTLNVPESWDNIGYGARTDAAAVYFSFLGGSVNVQVKDNTTLEDVWKKKEAELKKNAESDSDYKYKVSDESQFNTNVKKTEITYKTNDAPYKETQYIFKKNDLVYTLILHLNDAADTAQNEKALQQIWQTMQLQ